MLRRLFFLLLICSSLASFAVTDKEMQQAEAITAKQYLRWANDGSGYLDEISVSTISELQGKLRTQKDKDNLQTFRSAANPGDYSSWTKEQLVSYWSDTFFQSSKLDKKGKGARSSVKTKLNALSIAPPSQSTEKEKETVKADTVAKSPQTPVVEEKTPEQLAAEQAALDAQADSIAMARAQLAAEPKEEPSDSTPIYIAVLCALICLVIFLVVYASKVMGKSGNQPHNDSHRNSNPQPIASNHYQNTEHQAAMESLQRRYDAMADENRRLNDELQSTRTQLRMLTEEYAAYKATHTATTPVASPAHAPAPTRKSTSHNTTQEPVKDTIIYLGRVNQDGLFVRADRAPAPGYTIFLLRTDDGYTGSFRVVNNPEVWQLCLNDPERYLMGGAEGDDLEDTDGFSRVVNQGAGTAIFEDGCWKVLRKASVAYD